MVVAQRRPLAEWSNGGPVVEWKRRVASRGRAVHAGQGPAWRVEEEEGQARSGARRWVGAWVLAEGRRKEKGKKERKKEKGEKEKRKKEKERKENKKEKGFS
jgi:hypothetical protein